MAGTVAAAVLAWLAIAGAGDGPVLVHLSPSHGVHVGDLAAVAVTVAWAAVTASARRAR